MMSRRSFLGALGAAATTPSLARASLSRLNVLYISSDEHNPSLLGGHPVVSTPHIDRLAARSLSCTRA